MVVATHGSYSGDEVALDAVMRMDTVERVEKVEKGEKTESAQTLRLHARITGKRGRHYANTPSTSARWSETSITFQNTQRVSWARRSNIAACSVCLVIPSEISDKRKISFSERWQHRPVDPAIFSYLISRWRDRIPRQNQASITSAVPSFEH